MIYLNSSTWGASTRRLATAGGFVPYEGIARPGDTIINWGGGTGYSFPRNVRVLNRHLIYNKRDQGLRLMQANVSIPYIYLTHDEWLEAGCPQILQKPEYGQAGRGIKLVEPRAFQYNYIYQKYIPKTREFRVAIVGNIFAYAMEKLPPTDADEIRWNQCRGSEWTQVHDLRSLTPKFVRLGGAGLRALGYDFGGMDIIMDADGTLYILEINSKPGVGEVNSRKLADALKCYIQEG